MARERSFGPSAFTSADYSRRNFLKTASAGGALMLSGRFSSAWAEASPLLRVDTRILDVNGKASTVFSIMGPGGKPGLFVKEGDRFSGLVRNATKEPLALHWHGQALAPNNQDRARPDAKPLAPGETDSVDFELTPGTHWMHSHSLTEQQLLAAPMIAKEKNAGDVQDVVVMLHDFAFRSPAEILSELGANTGQMAHQGMGMSGHGNMPMGMPGMPMGGPGGHSMNMMGMMGMAHANI